MDAAKSGVLSEKQGTKDVVLQISQPLETKIHIPLFSSSSPLVGVISPVGSAFASSPPTINMPPKVPDNDRKLIQRKSFARSTFSKPKSRLVEPAFQYNREEVEERTIQLTESGSPYRNVASNAASPASSVTPPRDNLRSLPATPKTPLIGTPGGEEEDDDEVYMTATRKLSEKSGNHWRAIPLMEWTAFACFTGFLVATLTVHKLRNTEIWGVGLWKWSVLVLLIFCGRLVTEWMMNLAVFLIERNFLLKKKVLYFVYGLKESVQVFIYLSFVLLAWGLLFNIGVKRSRKTSRVLTYITKALGSCLIGSAMWMVKTLLLKMLSSSYQSSRFFDRIQESIFHQYVVRILSGPPLMEMAESISSNTANGQLRFTSLVKKDQGHKGQVIDVEKLKKIKQEKVSAWTMKGLIDVISGSGLSTISNGIDRIYDEEDSEQKDTEITSEWEARAAAYRIFKNVAKPGRKFIEEEDLLRFMKQDEVHNILPMFEGAVETGKIKRSTLKNWLVNVYKERKSLAHSLKDTKTAVDELNKLVSAVLVVAIITVGLLLMGFLTTKILVFISSHLLLLIFMFGNTAKTVFEAIIFVFVMHPFDVGDRCVIDGVQMVVEEMNILSTVFLRYDNEKIFYPNSVLSTKPISNFYRSPEMGDSVEFTVDVSTSVEQIGGLKSKIKEYLESKPQYWRPGHSVQVKEIENVNKMKMGLYVTHTINFQNYGDKSSRRSELMLELKKIFEALDIKYHLLPQEVHVSYVGQTFSAFPPPARL